jgi:hypothetical protein
MSRLLTSLILCLGLAGCGEVVVFGHVVRENPAKTEAEASKPATEPATPAPAVAAQPAAAPAAPTLEVAPEPATAPVAPALEATAPPATEVVAQSASAAAAPSAAIAASSTPATREAVAAAGLPTAHLLHAVNVTLAPASQTDAASVDAAALLDAIQTELRSRKLLDEQNPSANGTAEVLIESATARRTVNAVVFGRQPMAGTLTGQLRVSGASGELPASKIVAESRFSVADDGQDKNALGPLYRQFAVLTADELTGLATHAK